MIFIISFYNPVKFAVLGEEFWLKKAETGFFDKKGLKTWLTGKRG